MSPPTIICSQSIVIAWTIFYASITSVQGQLIYNNNNSCGTNASSFCHCELTKITCDCEGDVLQFQDSMVQNREIIKISNCRRLTIESRSLIHSGPVRMTLQDIADLRLKAGSFEMDVFGDPRISLTMTNTSINIFPSRAFSAPEFGGRVLTGINPANARKASLELTITNTTINELQSNAFANFMIDSMSIMNSTVKYTSQAAINNSFSKSINIVNTKFGVVEENAFLMKNDEHETGKIMFKGNSFEGDVPLFLSGTINGDVYISDNNFNKLEQSPCNLRVNNDVLVNHNTFTNIPSYGLNIKAKNRVTISNNTIMSLQSNALQLIVPLEPKTTIFLTANTIHSYESMSLCLNEGFDKNYVVIRNNIFKQECSCDIVKSIADGLGNVNLTAEMLYEDKQHQQWLQHGECLIDNNLAAIDLYLVQECLQESRLTTVLLLVFAVILITVAIFVVFAFRKIQQKRNTMQQNADYQSFSVPNPPSQGQTPWSLVQPDSRTYQETEIHIVFDKAKEMAVIDDDDANRNSARNSITKPIGVCTPIANNSYVTSDDQNNPSTGDNL